MIKLSTLLALCAALLAQAPPPLNSLVVRSTTLTDRGIDADLFNASTKDITAGWVRVTNTDATGHQTSSEHFFETIWSVGMNELRAPYLPAGPPVPSGIQIGAIHPGSVYHWQQNSRRLSDPPAVRTDVQVTAVVYLGGTAEGDPHLVTQIFKQRLQASNEYAYWVTALEQVNDVAQLTAVSNQSKTRTPYDQAAASSVQSMIQSLPNKIAAGFLKESDAIDFVKLYVNHMATTLASESVQKERAQ